MPKGVYLWSSS